MSDNNKQVLGRLERHDASLIRLDVTSSLFANNAQETAQKLIQALPYNDTIESVHLSGVNLESYLTPSQIEQLVLSIGSLKNMKDLSVFQGSSKILNEELLSRCLQQAKGLQVLLVFQFPWLHKHPVLASTLRHHPNLERVTLNLPYSKLPWACLDVYAMGFCQMTNLRVLQIRCCQKHPPQEEPLISPEAIALLLSSKTIHSLIWRTAAFSMITWTSWRKRFLTRTRSSLSSTSKTIDCQTTHSTRSPACFLVSTTPNSLPLTCQGSRLRQVPDKHWRRAWRKTGALRIWN